jgi:hypothetical protein
MSHFHFEEEGFAIRPWKCYHRISINPESPAKTVQGTVSIGQAMFCLPAARDKDLGVCMINVEHVRRVKSCVLKMLVSFCDSFNSTRERAQPCDSTA